MSQVDAPVLIVGGGPVGMALALGLARLDVPSIVLERHRHAAPHDSRPHLLTPNTLEVLSRLGVARDFVEVGHKQQLLHAWPIGNNAATHAVDFAALPTRFKYLLLIAHAQTDALLTDAALSTGLVQLRRGHTLLALHQDTHRAYARVMDAQQHSYGLCSRFVVGCDGLRSTVRNLLHIPMRNLALGTQAVVADVRADPKHDGVAWPRFFYEHRQLHMALRLGPGLWRTLLFLPARHDASAQLHDTAVLTRAQALVSDCAPSFRIVHKGVLRLQLRTARQLRRGRVLLAGAAAHVSSPLLGQSINTGLADVDNLAWKLHGALSRHGHAQRLLDSYAIERQQASSSAQTRLLTACVRLLCLRLPTLLMVPLWRLLGVLARWAPLQQRLLARLSLLDTHYPHSPLFIDHHPQVGRRAPDAPLLDYRGMRASLGARHNGATLLLFEGEQKSRAAALLTAAAIGVKDVTFWRILRAGQPAKSAAALCDCDNRFWRAWDAHPGMVALIRPDGVVGCVVPQAPASVAAACTLLRHVLGMRPGVAARPRPRPAPSKATGTAALAPGPAKQGAAWHH